MRITIPIVAVAFSFVLGACSDASDAQRVDWTIVQNRLWIERMPKDARDMVKQLVLLDDEGDRVGAAMLCSRFRYHIDLALWQGKGDALKLFFLQAKEERQAKVRVWNCTGKAPAPFELCLELQDQNHKRVYFSKKDWVIESVDDARTLASTLAPAGDDDAPARFSDDDDDGVLPPAQPLQLDLGASDASLTY